MTSAGSVLASHRNKVALGAPRLEGRVTRVLGMLIEGNAPNAAVGDLYRVESNTSELVAEVVALNDHQVVLMPFGHSEGLHVGARLIAEGTASTVSLAPELCGRVLDALGRPLDNRPPVRGTTCRPIYGTPLPPLSRAPIAERLGLGIRSLDAFVPCGCGQRLGIFAGPGVGKSMLLGSIAKSAAADVVVLALVGERGREVGQFVEEILGADALAHTVVVVATSDRPPPERVRAAFVATTIAEYFRDQGKSVLLFVDSLTRFAMAQREVGLAVGEPPTTKGYPPSTFAVMPKLLERAAPTRTGGSITGFYAVLVEGDDLSDPVADSARSLLDGHIVLSRRLAERGHYPAVDVLQSLSRLETQLCAPEILNAARTLRGWMSRVEESRDLISVGAYRPGADVELDRALRQMPRIEAFLRQGIDELAPTEAALSQLLALVEVE